MSASISTLEEFRSSSNLLAMNFDSAIELSKAKKQSSKRSETEKDLLTLGIDIDQNVIERLQSLGLNKAWAVASRAAKSIKERDPDRLYSKYPTVTYNPTVISTLIKSNSEPAIEIHTTQDDELLAVDQATVTKIVNHLNNRESTIPANIRSEVNKMIHYLRINYGRSPDKFIQQMLGKKSHKVFMIVLYQFEFFFG